MMADRGYQHKATSQEMNPLLGCEDGWGGPGWWYPKSALCRLYRWWHPLFNWWYDEFVLTLDTDPYRLLSDIVVPIVDVHGHMDSDFRLPPAHMERQFGDPPFFHLSLLRDETDSVCCCVLSFVIF